MVTCTRHAFGNPGWPCASLTGGTQFVNVDQSYHKTFGRSFKFCKELTLQTGWTFRFWSLFW